MAQNGHLDGQPRWVAVQTAILCHTFLCVAQGDQSMRNSSIGRWPTNVHCLVCFGRQSKNVLRTYLSSFLQISTINILRGLPCRCESLHLKFTSEPSIFVDGDLAESIKRSRASDRLGDFFFFGAVGSSPDVSRVFSWHLATRHLNLSRCCSYVLLCRTQANSSHFNTCLSSSYSIIYVHWHSGSVG